MIANYYISNGDTLIDLLFGFMLMVVVAKIVDWLHR